MSRDRSSGGSERRPKRSATPAGPAASAGVGNGGNGGNGGGAAAPDATFSDREVPLPEAPAAAEPARQERPERPERQDAASFDPPAVDRASLARLLAGQHHDPHSILGAHPTSVNGVEGAVVRAMHPDTVGVEVVLPSGEAIPTKRQARGVYAAFVPGMAPPMRYRLRYHFRDGGVWERDDPYRFLPTVGDVDLHLFNEGTHRRLWEKMGAHVREVDGVRGVSFAVWAPNARRVSVVGDFCGWDGRVYPMRLLGGSGVWELFVPEISPNALYKYELITREGLPRLKTDPFAFKMQQAPETASIVVDEAYAWGDAEWMEARRSKDVAREPMYIYEVHLGSWARVPEDGNRSLGYREIAPRLAEHVTRLGFTHVELLPVAEHPFFGSWGYQVSGYFAPTSRFGSPEELKFLIDTLHRAGVGVIVDWVPAHFPKDDYALRRFDGTALFEHEDPRLGEHPDWGTLIFNFGRNEVKNYLIANALYWLEEFHMDGLRVDAVASMLYLDYSRQAGQWMRNRYGGRENLEAIDFIKQMNWTVQHELPGCFTVAEESTAWPAVTKPPQEGGLGFTFKWNMGWMHDTLEYFKSDPIYRRFKQDQLTFAMMYEYSERFIMPLSHDEVVHLKRSLLDKMPGDAWQKFANLRLLMAYMLTRPGKKLLFMGAEIAQGREWNHDSSLDWHLPHQVGIHGAHVYFMQELGRVYREHSAFWRFDHEPQGFSWIDVADKDNSVVSYVRRDGDRQAVVAINLTPVPRGDYRIGAPSPGRYQMLLNSDDRRFGGSGWGAVEAVESEEVPFHGYPQSLRLNLPPLGALVLLAPEPVTLPPMPDESAAALRAAQPAAPPAPSEAELADMEPLLDDRE